MNPLTALLCATLAVGFGNIQEPRAASVASVASVAVPTGKITSDCSLRGKKLHGRVKIVTAFPDFKVKKVEAFEDLKVKRVNAFPNSCGKWEFVDAFPDFTIQYVDAFPDFTIRFVTAFPGL